MGRTQPTPCRSRVLRFGLSLVVLVSWLSGCASFPGKSLPNYTYEELAPAPEEKMCLVVSEKGVGRNREILDKTIAMLEKSGYFLKAPE